MAINYVPFKQFTYNVLKPSSTATGIIPDESVSHNPTWKQMTYGRARPKSLCDWIDCLTLICSFTCLAVCVLVVSPTLPYAWRLGYNSQLIVLGFMLAIMNLCSKRISTRLFVMIEARWGSSTLQNFDAILRQSIFVPQTSLYWMLTLLLLTSLPLGLGVAYKSFVGGSASQPATNISIQQYGMFNRPYTNNQTVVAGSAIEAMLDFLNAASSDEVGPTYAEKPQPFGFNQLLISNGTSAVLDMPNATILATIQGGLKLGENLIISADVQGTVAIYNTSTLEALKNDTLWRDFYELHTFESYRSYRYGLSWSTYLVDAFIWLGGYEQTCGKLSAGYVCDYWYEHYNDVNSTDVEAFRASNMTLLFNIYRQPCSATWNVTASTVVLLEGHCTDVREPNRFQNIDGNMMPYIADLVDVYQAALNPFIVYRPDSAWRVPSYAMLAATAYWTRWSTYGVPSAIANPSRNLLQDLVYNNFDEAILSTRPTLAARPWLYIVLLVQPALTVLFLLFTICLYSTPIDSGFGLTSILASVDEDSLHYLHGAGLSGELTQRLCLNFAVTRPAGTEQVYMDGRIRSSVGLVKDSRQAKIEWGRSFG